MSKTQVSHDNWGYPPFNRESFQNVQGLFPTARLKRGSGPASDIPMNLQSIEAVEFENLEGNKQSIRQMLDATYTDAFLVLQDGALIHEEYMNNMGPDTLHLLNSVTKSFVGMLTGILYEKGIIDPDKNVSDYIPEFKDTVFSETKLQQLFGRYSTYVGGSPLHSPALMALVWQAEARGVWTVEGGISSVARAIEKLAMDRGVEFNYGHRVIEIQKSNSLVNKVYLDDGTSHGADAVIFNGDPRALATGLLGSDLRNIANKTRNANRSLSANVWGFESKTINKNLVHHNVFFSDKVNSEFFEIEKGQIPLNPTLYICAQDREEPNKSQKSERFEIILNAPPLSKRNQNKEDFEICKSVTLECFKNFGLNFQVDLERRNLTTPKDFNDLFPATEGSLYGQSPHGMMATFQRPKCVTSIANLFLVGGGVHPGAGVPMATLSALLAVEEMKTSQILI